jgi:5'-nucleotidase
MKLGKSRRSLSCVSFIDDESSIRNRTSTFRLTAPAYVLVKVILDPLGGGLPDPPRHATPVMTTIARAHRNRRMRASYMSAICLAALSLVAPSTRAADGGAGAPGRAPLVTISIVGTNDLHGHIEALPRLGGYIANLRRARARDGGGVVLLDAGDMFQGTLESNTTEGAAVVRAYNVLKYDAAAIGNHEFDFGPVGPATAPGGPADDPRGALKARAAEAHFPFLAANLIDTATGAPPAWRNFGATRLLDVAGVKVGIIGIANPWTASITLPANFAGLRALPDAPAVVTAARTLRRDGAAAVIVVAHVGGTCARFTAPDDLASCASDSDIFQLARALPAGTVDAIVAGHTHAGIAHRVAGIPIIEAYDKGYGFGRIDLWVRSRALPAVVGAKIFPPQAIPRSGAAFSGSYEGAPLTPDPTVAAAIAPALAAARARREAPLGVTVARPIAPSYDAESALGNLFTDLMRAARPKADVALTTGGSIRAQLPAGALTYGQLYEAIPFDDRFVTMAITGADLAALVARNLERAGGIVSLSGVRASAACAAGAVAVTLARPDGKPVGPGERLTIVTSEFLATGGGGFFPEELRRRAAATTDDGPPIRDAMVDVLRARKTKTPLDPTNPPLHDPAHPRLAYPGRRPVHCTPSSR